MVDHRREPTSAQKLDVLGNAVSTAAVLDDEAVDSGEVKYHQVSKRGGARALYIPMVPKPHHETKSSECDLFEETSVPLL